MLRSVLRGPMRGGGGIHLAHRRHSSDCVPVDGRVGHDTSCIDQRLLLRTGPIAHPQRRMWRAADSGLPKRSSSFPWVVWYCWCCTWGFQARWIFRTIVSVYSSDLLQSSPLHCACWCSCEQLKPLKVTRGSLTFEINFHGLAMGFPSFAVISTEHPLKVMP